MMRHRRLKMSAYSIFLSAALLCACRNAMVFAAGTMPLRERPVVGILSQPMHHGSYSNTTAFADDQTYYIAASYVKWIESAGAVSIPIPYDADESLVTEIFGQINGLLLPGGGAKLPQSVKHIWKLALERNQNGEYFPIWGTCLGFEFLITLTSAENGVMNEGALQNGFNAENVSLPLIFPSQKDVIESNGVYSLNSQLYSSSATRDMLSLNNITMNNHVQGITPGHFMSNKRLTSMFRITSTNIDLNGRPFVSTIESILYPIYGVQYHPEKNNFEYGMQEGSTIPFEAISHSEEAVFLSVHLATFFGTHLRRSSIGEYTLADRHPMIMDYPVGKGTSFEQIYIIPSAENWGRRESAESRNEKSAMIIYKTERRTTNLPRLHLRGSASIV